MVVDTALIVFHSQTTIYMNTFFGANRSNETARRYCVMPGFFFPRTFLPFSVVLLRLDYFSLGSQLYSVHGWAMLFVADLCDDSGAKSAFVTLFRFRSLPTFGEFPNRRCKRNGCNAFFFFEFLRAFFVLVVCCVWRSAFVGFYLCNWFIW